MQTVGDDCAKDLGILKPDGSEMPALVVFKPEGRGADWYPKLTY